MKKLSLLFVAIFLVFATAHSQDAVFGKNNSAINLGIGFGSTILHGVGYKMGFPSISVSYEYGIVEVPMGSKLTGVVSAGGLIGYGGAKYESSLWDNVSYNYNYFLFAARGNYHFIFHDKFDPYAGILIGYYILNGKWKGSGTYHDNWTANSGAFRAGVYVGARWFFTPAIAVFTELGYGMSYFTIGGTFKF